MAGITALVAATVVGACGGQEPADTSMVISDDPELRAVVAELLPELARRSGLELRAPVTVSRRSREQLVSYLGAQLDEEMPPEKERNLLDSYRLLGLVPDSLDLRGILLSVYTEQVAGFYDPDSTALFVMDDQPAEALRPVLVHELVHAVQDQAAPLDSLTAPERGNDRRVAAHAAIEGHATLVMLEYLLEEMRGEAVDLSEIPDFASQIRPTLEATREQYPELAAAPRVIQESLLFPYIEGAGFVQAVWRARDGRPAPFGEWLPESTEQVLSPSLFIPPGRDEPTAVQVSVPGSRALYEDDLGALETSVLLEELGADPSAAGGWDGDAYVLLEPAPGERALVWVTVWDDSGSRDRFVSAVSARRSAFPLPAEVEAVELDGRPGAVLRVGRAGDVEASLGGGPGAP